MRHVRHVDAIFAECDIVGCALNAMLYITGVPVGWQAPVVFSAPVVSSRIKSWGPVQKIYEVSPP